LKKAIFELSKAEENFLIFKKGHDNDSYDFALDENVKLVM
jgi:hypothetical protein